MRNPGFRNSRFAAGGAADATRPVADVAAAESAERTASASAGPSQLGAAAIPADVDDGAAAPLGERGGAWKLKRAPSHSDAKLAHPTQELDR